MIQETTNQRRKGTWNEPLRPGFTCKFGYKRGFAHVKYRLFFSLPFPRKFGKIFAQTKIKKGFERGRRKNLRENKKRTKIKRRNKNKIHGLLVRLTGERKKKAKNFFKIALKTSTNILDICFFSLFCEGGDEGWLKCGDIGLRCRLNPRAFFDLFLVQQSGRWKIEDV